LIGAATLVILLAGCATAPQAPGDVPLELPETVYSPIDPRISPPELEQRLSMAGMVAGIPDLWRARRHHDVRPFIVAEIVSPVGETVASLIRIDAGAPVAPETLLRFLFAEALLVDDLEAQEYLQPLEDGSYYAGVRLDGEEAVRLRFYDDGETVHALAVRGLSIAVERAEVEAMLLSLRVAEGDETNYRYRPSGVSIVERSDDPWVWLEDIGGGVAMTNPGGSGEIVAAITTLDSWEIDGDSLNATFWVGPRRVIATGVVDEAETQRELYRFEIAGDPYYLYLEMAGDLEVELLFVVSVARPEDGSYVMNAEVFSRPEDTVRAEIEESADSLFDVFEAADQLTLALIEEVTAVEVAFGSLTFQNRGFEGAYEVRIDNVLAGSRVAEIQRVLAGRRTVSIHPPGESEAVHRGEVVVPEGGTAVVSFELPFLPTRAQQELDRYHAALVAPALGASGHTGDPEAVAARVPPDRSEEVEELIDALKESSNAPAHETVSIEVVSRFRRWANRALTGNPVQSRPFLPALKEAWVFPDSAPVQRRVTIDGEVSDWEGIHPIRRDTDASGDRIDDRFGAAVERAEPGTDIAELRLAEGEEGVYLLLTFYDGAPAGNGTSYRITFEAPKQGQSDPWNRIGLVWTSTGGDEERASVRLIDLEGSDRQISAQSVPRRRSGEGIESVIPRSLIELSRSRTGMNGWDILAIAELTVDGETIGTDEIRYGTKVHF
ncbi:MAG: hypothetical protein ACOC28_07950, partial [Alkalispirochaetaceae bacterium]